MSPASVYVDDLRIAARAGSFFSSPPSSSDKRSLTDLTLLSCLSCPQGPAELEGADMKEIDGLLSHINKITHAARSGHRADSKGVPDLKESSVSYRP